jgi:hypothetical protein
MEPEGDVYEGLNPDEWKKVFSQLIEEIGQLSTVGIVSRKSERSVRDETCGR